MSIHRSLPALFDFSGLLQNDEQDRDEARETSASDSEPSVATSNGKASEPPSEVEGEPKRYGLALATWSLFQAAFFDEPPAR